LGFRAVAADNHYFLSAFIFYPTCNWILSNTTTSRTLEIVLVPFLSMPPSSTIPTSRAVACADDRQQPAPKPDCSISYTITTPYEPRRTPTSPYTLPMATARGRRRASTSRCCWRQRGRVGRRALCSLGMRLGNGSTRDEESVPGQSSAVLPRRRFGLA
jgi:hypothetical protein